MAFGTYSLLAFFLMRLAALVNAIPSPLEQEPPPSATSASPAPSNTVPYHIVASRDSSLVDLLPWKASGFNIYLGGQTTVFCPPLGCPGGNETAFHGYGSMDAMVPGGQLVYVAPDGHLGYTIAHDISYPSGSVPSPFIFGRPTRNQSSTYLTTGAFGAQGFMGCPIPESPGIYLVYADMTNATVTNGNLTACISFQAVASNYYGPPVYQYV